MKKYKAIIITLVVIISLAIIRQGHAAKVPPKCHWDNLQMKVVCEDGGSDDGDDGSDTPGTPPGGDGNNGSGTDNGGNHQCVPNGIITKRWFLYYQPLGRGPLWLNTDIGGLDDSNIGGSYYPPLAAGQQYCPERYGRFDSCGNFVGLASGYWIRSLGVCNGGETPSTPPVTNPCTITGAWTGTGFSATCHSDWECTAAVPLPPTYIDVRPYPVTLVRWPTAIRCSGQEKSNGSCSVSDAGDMENFKLSLEFRPATGVVAVNLPYLPAMTFNAASPTGQPTLFQWEVPSHPAVGANRLAGTLNGFFDEIPGDFPVFEGQMKTPYHLYWNVSFDKDGDHYSFDGELLPQDVTDLPKGMVADLNGDGTGDEYWDPNFVISRMDENNRTDNPLYERHWSYGELLPWAVREGQGQIGWPDIH